MFQTKNHFAHMWHIKLWSSAAHQVSFLLNQFSIQYRFPFPMLCFFYCKINKRYSKIGFSKKKKCSFKKSKNPSAFLRKTIGSNKSFTLIENNKIAKFEFKVTVHYGLWAKCTQLWALKNSPVHFGCMFQ